MLGSQGMRPANREAAARDHLGSRPIATGERRRERAIVSRLAVARRLGQAVRQAAIGQPG